jgi:hypothetical protein
VLGADGAMSITVCLRRREATVEFDDTNNAYSFNGGEDEHYGSNGGGEDLATAELENELGYTKDKTKQLTVIAEWVARHKRDGWAASDIQYEAKRIGERYGISSKKITQAVEHGYDLWLGERHKQDLRDLGVRLQRDVGTAPPAEAKAEIERLAKVPKLEYAQTKKGVAKELGISLKELEGLVKEARDSSGDTKGQGRPLEIPDTEPWKEPVNGAECLDEAVKQILRYMVMPEGAPEITALWAMFTHCFRLFMHAPRLAILSPEFRCGKTTLRDILQRYVARPLPTSNMTGPTLFRAIDMYACVVLLDEGDGFLKNKDDLISLLKDGHHREGQAIRLVGDNHELRGFSVFAPVAIAMIGKALPDGPLHDRAIVIKLRRRKPSERVQSFRSDRCDHLKVIARKMARWAIDNTEVLQSADPDTGELEDRVAVLGRFACDVRIKPRFSRLNSLRSLSDSCFRALQSNRQQIGQWSRDDPPEESACRRRVQRACNYEVL